MSEAEKNLEEFFTTYRLGGVNHVAWHGRQWQEVKAELARLKEENESLQLQLESCRESYADYVKEQSPEIERLRERNKELEGKMKKIEGMTVAALMSLGID